MKKRPFLCLELLNTFSEKEIKNLVHFVSCPCFNEDECIVRLLKLLKKHALGGKGFDAEKQRIIYEKTFTHKPKPHDALNINQRSSLNVKMNNLRRLAEQFIATQIFKENDSYSELLYDNLLKRKQYRLLNYHLEKHKKELSRQKKKGATYHAHQFKTGQVIFNFLYLKDKLKEDNLPDLIHSLDMYYLISKLELQLTNISMKNIPTGKEYSSMTTMNELLDLPEYAEQPLIIIYRACIALIETKSDEACFNLLDLLAQYESVVPISLLKDFYITTINHCTNQIRHGALDYYKNMFDVYKIMDKKNLLIDNGFISPNNLKNIVTAACRVEEFTWAEKTIERYRQCVQQPIRNSVCNFNLGVVAFHRKDYEFAHDRFIKVGKIDKIYDINIRVLILKCLYEKGKDYSEPTMQAFRSAYRFFREDKSLHTKSKKGYINFIKMLIKVYRLRHNVNATKADTERIKEELNAQKLNSDKRWLLEKIEEL